MGLITNYKLPDGTDLGISLVERSYLIDRYPELVNTFKQAGLWTWGLGTTGQLGDNTIDNKSSPVQTVAGGTNWQTLECGELHISSIKTDGTLWSWGYNANGQLGNSSNANVSSPVMVASGGNNWKQVSAGRIHTSAIKTDGTLWSWGWNSYGQIGNNNFTGISYPAQTAAAGTNWKQVACGDFFTVAIKTDGAIWAWGRNAFGALGSGAILSTNYPSPIQNAVAGGLWKQVACGESHVAAVRTTGQLYTWGKNDYGQLGDTTIDNKSNPVEISTGGANWKQVSCGSSHTAAIKINGTLWTWGRNTTGNLGDNTTAHKSSPVQTLSGGTNWKQVGTSFLSTMAIKTDGTLWLWGHNSSGQLGDNTITQRNSPVQTFSGGTNWKYVGSGRMAQFTCAIRDDSSDIFGNSI